jgi:hypothetical protein
LIELYQGDRVPTNAISRGLILCLWSSGVRRCGLHDTARAPWREFWA